MNSKYDIVYIIVYALNRDYVKVDILYCDCKSHFNCVFFLFLNLDQ
jgi:hypothetical protein